MNTMKFLLIATFGLLILALAGSFGLMQQGEPDRSDEITQLKKDYQRLTSELAELRSTPHSTNHHSAAPLSSSQPTISYTSPDQPHPLTPTTPIEIEQETEIQALKDKIKQLAAVAEANTAQTDTADPTLRREERKQIDRIQFIKNALLKAVVVEWNTDGNFAVIEIKELDLVTQGSVLTVRRGDGVIGRLEVQYIADAKNAIANPVKGSFPEGSGVEVGDELIEPPVY